MYPHNFAKFKKIYLDFRMSLARRPFRFEPPCLKVIYEEIEGSSKLVFPQKERDEFIEYVRRTRLFYNLRKILMNSPLIVQLEVELAVHNHIYSGDENTAHMLGDVHGEAWEAQQPGKNMEAFLDADIMGPLSALTNVKAAKVSLVGDWCMDLPHKNMGPALETKIVEGFGQLQVEEVDEDSPDEEPWDGVWGEKDFEEYDEDDEEFWQFHDWYSQIYALPKAS